MLNKAVLAITISVFLVVTTPQTVTAKTTSVFDYFSIVKALINQLEERQSAITSILSKLEENREKVLAETDEVKNETNFTATPSPTITMTPTLEPTAIPTVSVTVSSPTKTPSLTRSVNDTHSGSSIGDYILNQVNQYRQSFGLSNVSNDPHTCSFAELRAKELSTNFSHDGFSSRLSSNSLPYPGFSNVTENIAMHNDYRQVFNMWKNSSGHAANMRADTPHVCIANYGNLYAYEGWKP